MFYPPKVRVLEWIISLKSAWSTAEAGVPHDQRGLVGSEVLGCVVVPSYFARLVKGASISVLKTYIER